MKESNEAEAKLKRQVRTVLNRPLSRGLLVKARKKGGGIKSNLVILGKTLSIFVVTGGTTNEGLEEKWRGGRRRAARRAPPPLEQMTPHPPRGEERKEGGAQVS